MGGFGSLRFVAFSFPCSSLLRSLSSFFSLNFLFTISFAFALAILHGGDTNAKCHCHTLFIHFPEPRTNTQLFYIYFFPLFCMAANDRLTHSFPPPPSRPYDFSSKRLRNFNYTWTVAKLLRLYFQVIRFSHGLSYLWMVCMVLPFVPGSLKSIQIRSESDQCPSVKREKITVCVSITPFFLLLCFAEMCWSPFSLDLLNSTTQADYDSS